MPKFPYPLGRYLLLAIFLNHSIDRFFAILIILFYNFRIKNDYMKHTTNNQ